MNTFTDVTTTLDARGPAPDVARLRVDRLRVRYGDRSVLDGVDLALPKVTGTADLADRPVEELSGGQRQRAWIAMVLAQQTPVLPLDEPTTYLDLAHRLEVLRLLRRLNAQRGVTVAMVLHDLDKACRYADHLVALRAGRSSPRVVPPRSSRPRSSRRSSASAEPPCPTRSPGRHHRPAGRLSPARPVRRSGPPRDETAPVPRSHGCTE